MKCLSILMVRDWLIIPAFFKDVDNQISNWAELLETDGAKVLATYDRHWKSYAAITENTFGKGMTWYLGCWPNEEVVARLVEHIVDVLGLADSYHTQFPLIVKSGTNEQAEKLILFLIIQMKSKHS